MNIVCEGEALSATILDRIAGALHTAVSPHSRQAAAQQIGSDINDDECARRGLQIDLVRENLDDVFSLCGEVEQHVRDSICAIVDDQPKEWRATVIEGDCANSSRLVFGQERPAIEGVFGASTPIHLVASKFYRPGMQERLAIVFEGRNAFAAKVLTWDHWLDDYIHGVVTGAPPVLIGRFASEDSLQNACREIERNSIHSESMADMTICELLPTMITWSDWSLCLNCGDTGYSTSVFGTYNTVEGEEAIRAAVAIDREIAIGDRILRRH